MSVSGSGSLGTIEAGATKKTFDGTELVQDTTPCTICAAAALAPFRANVPSVITARCEEQKLGDSGVREKSHFRGPHCCATFARQ